MDRAPDSKSGCWGFESLLACHFICMSLTRDCIRFDVMDKAKQIIEKISKFLKEAKIELKKVTWPTPRQTMASTSVVIIVVIIVSLFLGIVDFGLSKVVRLVLG
jgi:preprotein translocase subunit SecE